MPKVRSTHLKALSIARASEDPDAPADDALMQRAAVGDTHAFCELIERYQARVRGFCRVLLRDEVLAYDLSQEVFLKIWTHRGRYRGEGRFKECNSP